MLSPLTSPLAQPFSQALFKHFDPLAKVMAVMSDSASRYRRQSSIFSFVTEALEPMAAQEAADSELKRQARVSTLSSASTLAVDSGKKSVGTLFDSNVGKPSLSNSAVKRQTQRRLREETSSPSGKERQPSHLQRQDKKPSSASEVDLTRMDEFPSLTEGRSDPVDSWPVGRQNELGATYAQVASVDQFSEALPLSNRTAYSASKSDRETVAAEPEAVPMELSAFDSYFHASELPTHSIAQFLSPAAAAAAEEEEEFEDLVVFRPAFSSRSALLNGGGDVGFAGSPGLAFSTHNSTSNLLGLFNSSAAEEPVLSVADGSELLGQDIFASLGLRASVSSSRLNDYTSAGVNLTTPANEQFAGLLFSKGNESVSNVGKDVKLSHLFESDSFQDYWNSVPGAAGQVDTFTSLFEDGADDRLPDQWQPAPPAHTHLHERSSAVSTTPLQSTPPPMAAPPGLQAALPRKVGSAPPGLMQPPPPLVAAPNYGGLKTLNPFYSGHG